MLEGTFIDLSKTRFRFKFIGEDRVRYLNGQVTNQVERASEQLAIPACVCNHKGKLDGIIQISTDQSEEALLVDGPIELRDSLFARLSKYIIADDVEVIDITDESTLLHRFSTSESGISSNRFGYSGEDLWNAGELSGVEAAKADILDQHRIEALIPQWGKELSNEVLPAEAGLHKTAVDFHKGCYLGQEVVSRIQSVGRVNRSLALLSVESNVEEVEEGDPIGDPENVQGKPLGHITSVSPDGLFALGYVRHTHLTPETKLVSISQNGKVTGGLTVLRIP